MPTSVSAAVSERRTALAPSHFAYIDAVRGFAFLAVLVSHVTTCVGPFPGRDVVSGGDYGVQLFFLASAITLCYSMEARSKVDRRPLLSFYLRRVFRIAPLFWLAMVFYWVFPGVMPSFWLGQFAPLGVRPSYFLATAAFVHGWAPYAFNSIVPGGWSIAVEMNFYVLFPVLFRYLGKSFRFAGGALLASVVYLRVLYRLTRHPWPGITEYVWQFFSMHWLPAQLPVFVLGFFVYHLTRDRLLRQRLQSKAAAVWGLLGSLLVTVSALRGSGLVLVPQMMYVSAGLSGMIVSLSGGSLGLFVNKALCRVGRLSYSCYLVHFAALGFSLRLLGIHLDGYHTSWDAGSPLRNGEYFAALCVASLVLTISISMLTERFVEQPGIALGRVLIRRINSES